MGFVTGAARRCRLPNSSRRAAAAGGEIVEVKREDDANGKWNYEVVVRSNGKEWGFEVAPKGKFVKQHSDIKK